MLKCFPDKLIKKFKAQFYAREDQQIESINVQETTLLEYGTL